MSLALEAGLRLPASVARRRLTTWRLPIPFAVRASIEQTEAALLDAFRADGWVAPSPGKPAQVFVSLHAHEHGCLILDVATSKSAWEDRVGQALAQRIVAEGGWVLRLNPGISESELTEWDSDGVRHRKEGIPEAYRSYDDDRLSRRLLSEAAASQIGTSKRRAKRYVEMRFPVLKPIDEVLAAIQRGDVVSEVSIEGAIAFRFPHQGGVKMVVLDGENAERVRSALREA